MTLKPGLLFFLALVVQSGPNLFAESHSPGTTSGRFAADVRSNSNASSACFVGRPTNDASQDAPPPIPPKPERKPQKKSSVCPQICSNQFTPVSCKAGVLVDDMISRETVIADNECFAKAKLCQTTVKNGFKPSDVSKFVDLSCTRLPEPKYLEEVKNGSPFDRDDVIKNLKRREGRINHPGKLVKDGEHLVLLSGREKFELDLSSLSREKREKIESLVGQEDVGIEGTLQYLYTPEGEIRNDAYRINVSDASQLVF